MPRQRSGPEPLDPLPIYHAAAAVLESLTPSAKRRLTWFHFTLLIQETMNYLYSDSTLRPHLLWFVYMILVRDDIPPRLRYKVGRDGNPKLYKKMKQGKPLLPLHLNLNLKKQPDRLFAGPEQAAILTKVLRATFIYLQTTPPDQK